MRASTERLLDLLQRAPTRVLQPLFHRHGVSPRAGVEALVNEITLDGSNTIAAWFRGGDGVTYGEIVRDVADKVGVRHDSARSEIEVEHRLLEHLIRKWIRTAPGPALAEVRSILDELGRDSSERAWRSLQHGSGRGDSILTLLLRDVNRDAVAKAVSQIVALVTARALGQSAALGAVKAIGWAVPFLNAVVITWTVVDIAGPAYRKTVPTVLEVAQLRIEYGEKTGA